MSEITVPYLAEHQAPDNNEGGKPGYNPSPEEKKIIQLVDSLYSKAKKYRKRYDQRWIDWYKMFRGRQWKEVRPSYRSSEVLNKIFETIQSMVPVLVESQPILEFLPTTTSHTQFELAEILSKVAKNDWEHNNWLEMLLEVLYDSHFYGNGISRLKWDPEAKMGLGQIIAESTDVFYFFPDPQARDIQGKRTKYIITAEPTDISEIKKEYPDKAPYIAADVIDFAQGDKADIYQVMFKSPTDSKLIIEGPSGYDAIAKNQTLKITLWAKDDDFEEESKIELKEDGTPKLDDNGSPVETFTQKRKYPRGRCIIIAGGVLLDDYENENEDGLYPFAKLDNYVLPREFWSVGEVENLDGPQKTINKLLAFTLDCMSLMGNPIFIVDDSSQIDTDNLFNKPGLVIEKAAGSEVRRESGVELPQFILPLIDRYMQYFDGVSGQTDLSKGIEPTQVIADSAIASLQEAQQTRLRLKSKHIDSFLRDFGKLYLDLVFQHYSVPRIVRVSGDVNAQEWFYFHVEKVDETNEAGAPVSKRYAQVTSPDGSAKRIEIEGDFDVRVSTGSSLPFAKEAKGEMSLNLFKLGIIDAEEVLKNFDYPNYEQVMERMQQQRSAQMQAQKMQMKMAMQAAAAKTEDTQAKAMKSKADAQRSEVEAAIMAHDAAVEPPKPVRAVI